MEFAKTSKLYIVVREKSLVSVMVLKVISSQGGN